MSRSKAQLGFDLRKIDLTGKRSLNSRQNVNSTHRGSSDYYQHNSHLMTRMNAVTIEDHSQKYATSCT